LSWTIADCSQKEESEILLNKVVKVGYLVHDRYFIDLFAGCGGLSLGLHKAQWKGLFAIEKSPLAFLTLKHNSIDNQNYYEWPSWLPISNFDINQVIVQYKDQLTELRGKVHLIAGGPPCQGFSTAGKRDGKDERNSLVHAYIEFVKIVKPKLLFFENVKGFTLPFKNSETVEEPYSSYVERTLQEIGYKITKKIVDFSEYGIPQRRLRYILIGSIDNEPISFFDDLIDNRTEFLKSKGLQDYHVTVGEAISDLLQSNGITDCPDSSNFKSGIYADPKSNYQRLLREGLDVRDNQVPDSHRLANHNENTINLFNQILKAGIKNMRNSGEELRKEYGLKKRGIFLLDESQLSPTLTTHPDDYIHYSEPRILTVREYARLQSFPDWYEFLGKYTTGGTLRVKEVPRYTQIGNAIPPLFAEQVGLILKEVILDGRKT